MHTLRTTAAAVAIASLLGGALPAMAAGGPTVTLSSAPPQAPTATGDTPIVVTAVVSTSTVNFNGGLVTAVNGSISNFSGSGTTYTFSVTPSNPSDSDPAHRLITVNIADNAFEGNSPASISFQYDSTATKSDSTAPAITFVDPSPADAATVASSSVTFAFTVDDASSTVMCSIVGQADTDSYFACASPQSYTLPDGAYRFTVKATDQASNTASSSRTFTMASTSAATSTDTSTGDTGGSGSTGGGGSTQTTSPSTQQPPHEGGLGSQIGGPEAGHSIIPGGSGGGTPGTPNTGSAGSPQAGGPTTTSYANPNPPMPTPQTTTATGADTHAPAAGVSTTKSPTISRGAGGSALVADNTPGTPNTGSEPASADTRSQSTAASSTATTTQSFGIPTSSLGAAAAATDTGIPGWVWLVLAGLILIGVGVWALRQPVA